VYLYNSGNITIEDCNTLSATKYGIYATGSYGFLTMLSDSIDGSATAGILVTASNANLVLSTDQNYIKNCGKGIHVENSKANTIDNNVIENSNSYGIYIKTSTAVTSISGNLITDVFSGNGIYLYRATTSIISGNTISGTCLHGLYIYASISSYSIGSITNNEISNVVSGSDGMYIDRINCNRVANNLIHDIGDDGIYYNASSTYTLSALDSNMIYHCDDRGIDVANAIGFNSITGNTIYNVVSGIYISSTNYFTVGQMAFNRCFSYSSYGMNLTKIQNTTIANNLIYGTTGSSAYGMRIYNAATKTVNIKNNTLYQAGKYGIYGCYVSGSWRNNIVMGSTYGFYGKTPFSAVDAYNCVYGNTYNWYSGISQGVGSFIADPLFVDPDGGDNVLGGDNWLDDDLHIKSTGGSYHFGLWQFDDQDSPCLDTGKPEDEYSLEPEDNGNRINIGRYGNTPEASKKKNDCPLTAVYPNFPNNKWVMIGVPVAPWEGNPQGDPYAIFGDDFGGLMPNGNNWYCIHWVTEDSVMEYYEYGDGTIYQPPIPYPGTGYFVWQGTGNPVDVDVTGCPVDHCVLDVAQKPTANWYSRHGNALGFNQFANPYYFTIDWSNAVLLKYPTEGSQTPVEYTLAEGATQGWISQYAYTWNPDLNQYEIVVPNGGSHGDSLSVWQGFYFMQIDSTSILKLNLPYRRVLQKPSETAQFLAAFGEKYRYRTASISPDWDWFLKMGVVSQGMKLQDVENGVGVSALARDGFDGWDAFEMRGTDTQGNYIQLEFVGENERTFAYDIHNLFDETSTWQMRVNTKPQNVKKQAAIVWPQMRLVPQNLKFTLLDNDNSTVLVEDLRQTAYYDFKISDSSKTYYLKATKVSDTTAPTFSFIFSSNPLAPNDLTFYIVSSEPLNSLSATVNGEAVNLTPVASPPNIYYGKCYVSGSSTLNLAITGSDAAGNSGTGSTSIQYQLSKTGSTNKIGGVDLGVQLELTTGTLSENLPIYLTRCRMDLGSPDEREPAGDPIYIGPDNITYQKKATLRLINPIESDDLALYRLTDGKWELVGQCQNSAVQISGSGTYCYFPETASADQKTTPPLVFALDDCYPNPFNNTTMIRYAVQRFGAVRLTIYDLLGRTVRDLVVKKQAAGIYQVAWDGLNNGGEPVASGIYYLSLKITNGDEILYKSNKKLTLIK
ncbi:MAG: right-handed parallel beta-helix repeat-containing protein, partial [Candidatus Neomarinimicrobiota bacterium]